MDDDFDDDDELGTGTEGQQEGTGEGDARVAEESQAEAGEDERLSQNEGDDEKKERRRLERHARRQRAKEREDNLRRELAATQGMLIDAAKRLEAVEQRGKSTDLAMVDSEIQKAANAYNFYKEQIAISSKNDDGATLSEAIDKMADARDRYQRLHEVKVRATQTAQRQPAPIDPRVTANSQKFLAKNAWYNPDVRTQDEDSRVLRAIDDAVAGSGFRPETQEYWDEVEARAKKYLPHRFTAPNNDSSGRKPPPMAGSGKDGGAQGTRGNSYTLSPERVAAMKEAGLWNDSKKREAMIKRYRETDKQGS